MDKATKERLNILAGVSTIEFFVRSKAMDLVDSVSNIHPMLKLYFDSKLNSDIENNALLAMSEAMIWSVETFTEKGPMSNFRSIGVSIAQTLSKRMYFAKLIHHANTGRITIEQFYDYASEYIAVEAVNVVNQLWDVVGAELPLYISAGIQKILEFFEVDPQTAEWIAGLIDSAANVAYSYVKRFLTQEKIQEFVYNALKFTFEAARKLSLLVDETVEKVKEVYHRVENKVKSWGKSICTLFDLKENEKSEEEKTEVVFPVILNKGGDNVETISPIKKDEIEIVEVSEEVKRSIIRQGSIASKQWQRNKKKKKNINKKNHLI